MSQQVIKVGQMEIRYLVDGAQSGGLGLFEMKVPAGARVPPPHHLRGKIAHDGACARTRPSPR